MSGTIVVGVDGSPSSGAALRWAASEAALRSARLIALHTWSYIPLAAVGDPGMIAMPSADLPGQLEAEQTAAQVELDSALAEAFPDGTPAELEARLAEGDAGETSSPRPRTRTSSSSALAGAAASPRRCSDR